MTTDERSILDLAEHMIPHARLALIRAMAKKPGTVRELAARTKINERTAEQAIVKLCALGIATRIGKIPRPRGSGSHVGVYGLVNALPKPTDIDPRTAARALTLAGQMALAAGRA